MKAVWFPLAVLLVCLGCAKEGESPRFAKMAAPQAEAPPLVRVNQEGRAVAGAVAAQAPNTPAVPMPRKVIRSADVHLLVDDFGQAEQNLKRLVSETHDCYIAQAEITGSSGAPRQGRWKIRVPAERFDAFVDALIRLGIPDRNHIDSEDVTEQFYDLEARIKNKKAEETRLLKHLDQSTGKLDEILTIERELTRVRGEVEQLQGRLQLLASVTSLNTVTVTMQEVKDYVPPQTPTFGNRLSTTYEGSLDTLISFGQFVSLIVVGLAPWLPLLAMTVAVAWLIWRKVRRSSAQPGQQVS